MHRTKTDAELAAAEAMHQDDPERAEILHRARRFKASWIELAESLSSVRRSGQWKNWGFDSFEEYAKRELHLKPETVDKLTGSYQFLQRRAPEVLRRDGLTSPIPSYQSIDFLRRAESAEDAPEATVSEIRRRVLDEAAPLPTVARQFREAVFPMDDAERKRRDAQGIRNVAGRLKELLAQTRAVPKRLAAEATEALDRLLEATSHNDGEKAA
jgi:lipopolysaccharide biosynthesis regulator YciM